MKSIEKTDRITKTLEDIKRLEILLKQAENSEITLSQISKELNIIPQTLNKELNNSFAFYFKNRLRYIDENEVSVIIQSIETSSEKLLRRILNIDTKAKIVYPEYNEDTFWSLAKSILPENYYNVIVKYYGYNCESMTLEAIGTELNVSKSRIKDINLSAITKLRESDFLNRLFNIDYISKIDELNSLIFDMKAKYDQVKAEYDKLNSYMYMINDIKAINEYIEANYPNVTSEVIKSASNEDFSIPIEQLNFSNRTYNALSGANYKTVNDICSAQITDIINIKSLGVKCYSEIISKLDDLDCTHPNWPNLRQALKALCI